MKLGFVPVPIRWFFLGMTLVSIVTLAGCGGGGNQVITPPTGGNPSPPPTPTSVTYTFSTSNGGVLPTAVAARIGTGSFSIQSLTGNKLTLSLPSGETKFAVAYLCPTYTSAFLGTTSEFIDQETLTDGVSFTKSCLASDPGPPVMETLQVDFAAIPGAAYASWGRGAYFANSHDGQINGTLPPGTYDLVLTVKDRDANTLAVKVLRSQTVPGPLNGGAPITFEAKDAVVPQTATYSGLPSGYTVDRPLVVFNTAAQGQVLLSQMDPDNILTVPATSFQSGDSYQITVQAYNLADKGAVAAVIRNTTSNGPESFSFPSAWRYEGPSPAKLPSFTYTYTGFSGQSNVTYFGEISWFTGQNEFNEIILTTTQHYMDASTSQAIPDLNSLTGFMPLAPSGTLIRWAADIVQGSLSYNSPPGGTATYVAKSGIYTQP